MTEITKRLQPKPKTLRELFLKSGNLCAFPNCSAIMMNAQGEFIGQLCHIEAAEEGGQRFNPKMSNEKRRAFSNLMLMCYPHHVKTNDVGTFTVAKLHKMKADHEARFSDPESAIIRSLKDMTLATKPVAVANLGRLNEVLKWNSDESELKEAVDELNAYIERFRRVPIEVRRFVGAVSMRIHGLRKSNATRNDRLGQVILASDVEAVFGLSRGRVGHYISQLESYGLGSLDQMSSSLGEQPAIQIACLRSGWDLWATTAEFCAGTDTPIEKFSENVDFSPFDV